MNKNTSLFTLALVSLAALFAACSEQPTSDPMSKSEASSVKSAFAQSGQLMITSLSNPAGFLSSTGVQQLSGLINALGNPLGTELQTAALNCTVNTTGNTQDQDNDKIPVRVSYSADCSQNNNLFRARMSLTDKDDNNRRSGYTLNTDTFQLILNSGRSNESGLILDLDIDLNLQNPNYSLRHNFNLTLYEPSKRSSLAYNYNTTYTPDDPENPFNAGTFNFNGTFDFRYNRKWFQLTAEGTGLKYSRNCSQSFVGGTVVIRDSRNNLLQITYNACNNVTAVYNGETL